MKEVCFTDSCLQNLQNIYIPAKDWSRRQQATQKSTSQPSSQGGGVAVILEASSLETVGVVVEVDWGGGGGLFLGQERRGEESLAYTGGYIGGI